MASSNSTTVAMPHRLEKRGFEIHSNKEIFIDLYDEPTLNISQVQLLQPVKHTKSSKLKIASVVKPIKLETKSKR